MNPVFFSKSIAKLKIRNGAKFSLLRWLSTSNPGLTLMIYDSYKNGTRVSNSITISMELSSIRSRESSRHRPQILRYRNAYRMKSGRWWKPATTTSTSTFDQSDLDTRSDCVPFFRVDSRTPCVYFPNFQPPPTPKKKQTNKRRSRNTGQHSDSGEDGVGRSIRPRADGVAEIRLALLRTLLQTPPLDPVPPIGDYRWIHYENWREKNDGHRHCSKTRDGINPPSLQRGLGSVRLG